jgi:chemotaxis signal transduction protein
MHLCREVAHSFDCGSAGPSYHAATDLPTGSMRTTTFVEAVLDPVRVGVPLQDIDRVVRAVAVQVVPGAPGCLLGAIDVAGEWVSVYDTRTLLGLPSRALRASDRIVLTRAHCGLVVDEVLGTVEPEPVDLVDRVALHAAGLRGPHDDDPPAAAVTR